MEIQKPEKRSTKRIFIILSICIIILLVLFTFSKLLSEKDISNNSNDTIYSQNYNSINKISPFGTGINVLSDNNLKYLDAGGNIMTTNAHSYSSPVLKTNGKRVLLYDKGGMNLKIEKNSAVTNELNFSSYISAACIGKYRSYAYSLDDDSGYQSHIYVFADNKNIFEWGSASDYCVDLKFNNSESELAVTVMGVNNAELYSKIMVFDLHKRELLFESLFKENAICCVDFINNNSLAVFTEQGLFKVLNSGDSELIYDYDSSELNKIFTYPNGLKVLLLSPYGNYQTPKLIVFDHKYKQLYDHRFEVILNDVTCNKKYVSVIGDDFVLTLNKDNSVTGMTQISEKCKNVILTSTDVYVLTTLGVHKYNVYSNNTNSDITKETTSENTTSAVTQDTTEAVSENELTTTEDITNITNEPDSNNFTSESVVQTGEAVYG